MRASAIVAAIALVAARIGYGARRPRADRSCSSTAASTRSIRRGRGPRRWRSPAIAIAAVGTTADIRALATPATRVIDLRGAFALPGFNDAHVHIDSTGALLVGVNLLDVHEPTAFTDAHSRGGGRLPKGSWITRGDWGAYEQWGAGSSGAARRAARRRQRARSRRARSDRCGDARSIRCSSTASIAACILANSLALKLAGITERDAESARRRDRQGRRRPARPASSRAPPPISSRNVIPPIPFEQRLVAGARRAQGSARGRRDDDAGPDVGGAAARLPGAAAPRAS